MPFIKTRHRHLPSYLNSRLSGVEFYLLDASTSDLLELVFDVKMMES